MPELPPLPPRPSKPAAAKEADRSAKPRPVQAERAKPDARPMRVVYGAGAVAAVSVMTVGLIQPTWDSSSSDPTSPPDVAPSGDAAIADQPRNNGQSHSNASQPAPDVRHVIRYVQLKPGQHAPPGARVITPGAPTPRIITVHSPPTTTGGNPPAANPPPQQHRPPPAAAPPPAPPPPKTTTHQSGHPR